jgi:hypothetical protein
MKIKTMATLVGVAGLAATAFAQDSVSQLGTSQRGDALIPWDTGNQQVSYVVDLSPFQTSRGTTFGVAPLMKLSKSSDAFFTSIPFAQSISADEIVAESFLADQYAFWNEAGAGVNLNETPDGTPNSVPQFVSPMAKGEIRQFAAVIAEQADTNAEVTFDSVLGAMVQYDTADPSRLYVTRTIAAIDGSAPDENFGQIRTGTVDASGNAYFRGDSFLASSAPTIGNDSIYRTNLIDRDATILNVISGGSAMPPIPIASDAAATDVLLPSAGTIHNTPSNIPQSINGRPIYNGLNFNSEYLAETSAGVLTTTTSHLIGTDPRGVLGTHIADLLGDGGTTAALLAKSSGGPTDAVNIFSVDSSGALIAGSPELLALPGSPLTDAVEMETLVSNGEYFLYRSQTNRQGGNAPVALGRDAEGRVLFAGTTSIVGAATDPFGSVIVGRFDPSDPDGTLEHAVAGYVQPEGFDGEFGKPVYDGDDNVIGEMVSLGNIPMAPNPGPSMSAPHIDGAGNVWFLAPVAFPDPKDPQADPFIRLTLLRAIYIPDIDGPDIDRTFGYRLEKVLAFRDLIQGLNSDRVYSVGGFQIADSNSVDSGTFWSSNGRQGTFGNIPASDLESNEDPRSTAGIVVGGSVLYDVDGDGDFTLNQMDDPTTEDELYNVLLYIQPIQSPAPPCPADLDGDNQVGAGDLAILIGTWNQMGVPADFNGDGVGADDLALLIGAWGPCPQ